METPAGLYYAETDEWAKVEGNTATVGISDYAQDQLSDVVYVEIIVGVGDTVTQGKQIATIESVKAAADVNAPVSGKVVAINEDLPQSPEEVNKDPYGQAWLIKVEISSPAELGKLMDAKAYDAFCQGRSH
jgi:glycine cleavage system H protein